MDIGFCRKFLAAQIYLCLATEVVLHLVWAYLVTEVVCVYLALLCWIASAREEVASEPGSASIPSCQALPVHGRGHSSNGLRKSGWCFSMVLMALVAAVTRYGISSLRLHEPADKLLCL